MKTVGFPISLKENENRRAIIPEHIIQISHPEMLYFETGYGDVLGYTNDDYSSLGCKIVNRETVLKCDIICDPKVGDSEYLSYLSEGQIIFGWIHATQNKDITDKIVNNKLTAFAWEKMYEEGRHVFWRNNELAGEAAIMHAYQCYGKMPYETTVAVIGRGNTARGAIKILNMLGAKVYQYDRKSEKLLLKEINNYDVIVNCVLWDVTRNDHIINKKDLKKMKSGSMIIDVSCDRHGGIETSVPTSIEKPIYRTEGIVHYVVDHTPALFYKTFSKNNSEIVVPYIELLINDNLNDILNDALIVEKGVVLDKEIISYQKR